MVGKMFRRIVIVWCIYGLVRICVFLNPWLFRLCKIIKPHFEDNSKWSTIPSIEWDCASTLQILAVWIITLIVALIGFLIVLAIHSFSGWFFNEEEEEEEEGES